VKGLSEDTLDSIFDLEKAFRRSLGKTIQLLEVQDLTGKIEVVIFDSKPKISKGAFIEVEGKVSKYQNNIQINANTIKEPK